MANVSFKNCSTKINFVKSALIVERDNKSENLKHYTYPISISLQAPTSRKSSAASSRKSISLFATNGNPSAVGGGGGAHETCFLDIPSPAASTSSNQPQPQNNNPDPEAGTGSGSNSRLVSTST